VRNRLFLGLLVGAALTIGLTACGSDDEDAASDTAATPQATTQAAATSAATQVPAAAAATPATPQAITVRAGDFFYEPSPLSAKVGTIVVTMQNVSTENRPHTFVVKGRDGSDMAKTERIAAGQSGTLEFTIREAGAYEYYCNLPGHADRGQKGTLTVTAS
jgi:plastocyanin